MPKCNALKLPLNGGLDFALNEKLDITGAHLQMRGDKGEISAKPYYDNDLTVQNIMLNADYDGQGKTATLHDFYGEIGDGDTIIPVTLNGKLSKDRILQVRLSLDKISVAQLKQYWPHDVAHGAYEWINENMDQGLITKAWLGLDANVAGPGMQLTNVEGMFDVEDAIVHYFGDYPKLHNVKGTASFNQDSFNIGILGADARDMKISDSRVIITGLGDAYQYMDINATLVGPVRTTLQILDTPPYKFASSFGLQADTAQGNAAMRLRFALPLIKAINDTDVAFSGSGNFTNVGLRKILAQQDLENANVHLDVDGNGLTMNGKGLLAGGNVEFDWTEHFAAVSPKTDVTFKAEADNNMRRAFALPGADYFSGVVNADGHYTSDSVKAADLALNLNLQPAAIHITPLNYNKTSGTPATAKLNLKFKDGRVEEARDIAVSGAGLNVKGNLTIDHDKNLPRQLNLNPFIIGNTNGILNIQTPAAGHRAIEFKGERFDASGLMGKGDKDIADMAAPKGQKNKKPSTPAEKTENNNLFAGLDTGINLGFNTVMLSKDQTLRNVGGGMRHDGTMWQVIDVDANLNPDGLLRIQWRPDNDGGRWLNIQANNAGAVLAGLGITDTMRGGMLSITGRGTGQLEPWGGRRQAGY